MFGIVPKAKEGAPHVAFLPHVILVRVGQLLHRAFSVPMMDDGF